MPICPKCRGESQELGAKCPRDEYYYIHEDALEDAQRDSWIGTLAADKYVIVALISEGGMGAVYRAIQLPVQREIAFKVLRAELQDSEQGKERFAREARAISRLSHPNIITMHDFGVDTLGHPFMAMEYAPGQSLADWMATPGLSLERICHVFRQILAAMSEAHEQGVIHRDLKPENLIVTRAGNDSDFVKLLDFGIARMVHDTATRGLTRDGEVFGTPHYMAPEQAQGKRDIGPQADVYALGIMFFELLSGACPFDAPTPLSILYMQINDDLPVLRPKNRMEVPEGLRSLITHATAKDPTLRFENAGAMLNAMDNALGDMSGVYARPGDPSGLFSRPAEAVEEPARASVTQEPTGPIAAKPTELDLPSVGPGQDPQEAADSDAFAPSNVVPVREPTTQPPSPTELDLDALESGDKRKYILVALIILLLGGGVALFAASGSQDDGAVSAAEKGAEPTPSTTPPLEEPAEAAQQGAQDEPEEQDEPLEAQIPPEAVAGASNEGVVPLEPDSGLEKAGDEVASDQVASDQVEAEEANPKSVASKPKPKKKGRKAPRKSPPKSKPAPKKFAPVKFGAPPSKKDTTPRKFKPK